MKGEIIEKEELFWGKMEIKPNCENCQNYKPKGNTCPKCGNNHWKGKSITKTIPSIGVDPERKEYYTCYSCKYKWFA